MLMLETLPCLPPVRDKVNKEVLKALLVVMPILSLLPIISMHPAKITKFLSWETLGVALSGKVPGPTAIQDGLLPWDSRWTFREKKMVFSACHLMIIWETSDKLQSLLRWIPKNTTTLRNWLIWPKQTLNSSKLASPKRLIANAKFSVLVLFNRAPVLKSIEETSGNLTLSK